MSEFNPNKAIRFTLEADPTLAEELEREDAEAFDFFRQTLMPSSDIDPPSTQFEVVVENPDLIQSDPNSEYARQFKRFRAFFLETVNPASFPEKLAAKEQVAFVEFETLAWDSEPQQATVSASATLLLAALAASEAYQKIEEWYKQEGREADFTKIEARLTNTQKLAGDYSVVPQIYNDLDSLFGSEPDFEPTLDDFQLLVDEQRSLIQNAEISRLYENWIRFGGKPLLPPLSTLQEYLLALKDGKKIVAGNSRVNSPVFGKVDMSVLNNGPAAFKGPDGALQLLRALSIATRKPNIRLEELYSAFRKVGGNPAQMNWKSLPLDWKKAFFLNKPALYKTGRAGYRSFAMRYMGDDWRDAHSTASFLLGKERFKKLKWGPHLPLPRGLKPTALRAELLQGINDGSLKGIEGYRIFARKYFGGQMINTYTLTAALLTPDEFRDLSWGKQLHMDEADYPKIKGYLETGLNDGTLKGIDGWFRYYDWFGWNMVSAYHNARQILGERFPDLEWPGRGALEKLTKSRNATAGEGSAAPGASVLSATLPADIERKIKDYYAELGLPERGDVMIQRANDPGLITDYALVGELLADLAPLRDDAAVRENVETVARSFSGWVGSHRYFLWQKEMRLLQQKWLASGGKLLVPVSGSPADKVRILLQAVQANQKVSAGGRFVTSPSLGKHKQYYPNAVLNWGFKDFERGYGQVKLLVTLAIVTGDADVANVPIYDILSELGGNPKELGWRRNLNGLKGAIILGDGYAFEPGREGYKRFAIRHFNGNMRKAFRWAQSLLDPVKFANLNWGKQVPCSASDYDRLESVLRKGIEDRSLKGIEGYLQFAIDHKDGNMKDTHILASAILEDTFPLLEWGHQVHLNAREYGAVAATLHAGLADGSFKGVKGYILFAKAYCNGSFFVANVNARAILTPEEYAKLEWPNWKGTVSEYRSDPTRFSKPVSSAVAAQKRIQAIYDGFMEWTKDANLPQPLKDGLARWEWFIPGDQEGTAKNLQYLLREKNYHRVRQAEFWIVWRKKAMAEGWYTEEWARAWNVGAKRLSSARSLSVIKALPARFFTNPAEVRPIIDRLLTDLTVDLAEFFKSELAKRPDLPDEAEKAAAPEEVEEPEAREVPDRMELRRRVRELIMGSAPDEMRRVIKESAKDFERLSFWLDWAEGNNQFTDEGIKFWEEILNEQGLEKTRQLYSSLPESVLSNLENTRRAVGFLREQPELGSFIASHPEFDEGILREAISLGAVDSYDSLVELQAKGIESPEDRAVLYRASRLSDFPEFSEEVGRFVGDYSTSAPEVREEVMQVIRAAVKDPGERGKAVDYFEFLRAFVLDEGGSCNPAFVCEWVEDEARDQARADKAMARILRLVSEGNDRSTIRRILANESPDPKTAARALTTLKEAEVTSSESVAESSDGRTAREGMIQSVKSAAVLGGGLIAADGAMIYGGVSEETQGEVHGLIGGGFAAHITITHPLHLILFPVAGAGHYITHEVSAPIIEDLPIGETDKKFAQSAVDTTGGLGSFVASAWGLTRLGQAVPWIGNIEKASLALGGGPMTALTASAALIFAPLMPFAATGKEIGINSDLRIAAVVKELEENGISVDHYAEAFINPVPDTPFRGSSEYTKEDFDQLFIDLFWVEQIYREKGEEAVVTEINELLKTRYFNNEFDLIWGQQEVKRTDMGVLLCRWLTVLEPELEDTIKKEFFDPALSVPGDTTLESNPILVSNF